LTFSWREGERKEPPSLLPAGRKRGGGNIAGFNFLTFTVPLILKVQEVIFFVGNTNHGSFCDILRGGRDFFDNWDQKDLSPVKNLLK
jgi:hypothetical protein